MPSWPQYLSVLCNYVKRKKDDSQTKTQIQASQHTEDLPDQNICRVHKKRKKKKLLPLITPHIICDIIGEAGVVSEHQYVQRLVFCFCFFLFFFSVSRKALSLLSEPQRFSEVFFCLFFYSLKAKSSRRMILTFTEGKRNNL